LTAKNYNIAFLDFVSYMRTHGISVESFRAVAEVKRNNEAARFPNNKELRDAIISRNQYDPMRPNRLRFIVEELEMASRDKFVAADGIKPGLWIEHIMPQQWQENWRTLPSGRIAPGLGGLPIDEAMALEMGKRNHLVHTLANLSLLTPPANIAASNGSFESKKPRLMEALLRMNLDIANKPKWGEAEIEDRAIGLANLAVKIWPSPFDEPVPLFPVASRGLELHQTDRV
jgi:hypothetical protein